MKSVPIQHVHYNSKFILSVPCFGDTFSSLPLFTLSFLPKEFKRILDVSEINISTMKVHEHVARAHGLHNCST